MVRDSVLSDVTYLTALRRDLHKTPELMYEEVETSRRVESELALAGVEFVGGLAGGTGVLGWLPASGGARGARTVALRADMDALPIQEETGLEWASQVAGKMHACGHDGHTAVLVGVARALAKEERGNNVLFVFQPAEEGGAGGRAMVEDGVLEGRILGEKADVIYGLHGWPDRPAGVMYWKHGPMLAATNEFTVRILGRGGHAAAPHLASDPVVAAAHVVTALQTVASRTVDPVEAVVVTVGAVHGGQAHNVIPEVVELRGTMRTLLAETRVLGERRFREIVAGVAGAMGCRAEVDWKEGYPVTVNDVWATERWRRVVEEAFGESRVAELEAPVMGGEDFSYYGPVVPASFFFVGLQREGEVEPPLLHTSRFDFNDAVIPDCVEVMVRLALAEV